MRPEVPLTLLIMLVGTVAVGHAETVHLSRETIPLRAGVTMDFATSQRVGFVDDYTSRIVVLAVEEKPEFASVQFRWRMFEAARHTGHDETGTVTVTGLADGTTLNAWWGAADATTRDTQLWLSRGACTQLMRTGQTGYAIDLVKRRDPSLLLTLTGRRKFPVTIDGQPRDLPAITIESARGDRLVMLADCRNPLILEIDVPKLYSARLTQVLTGAR